MNDFKKDNFYTEINEATGKKTFYIKINDQKVKVSRKVYQTCFNAYRKELRDGRRTEKYGLVSLDNQNEEGIKLIDTLSEEIDPIQALYQKMEVEKIMKVINSLNEEDKHLIIELLIYEKKEKELAKRYHISQQAINQRKRAILKKIRKYLENDLVKK